MATDETTVLVVDDEELNRDMLGRRLARRGYCTVLAEDGHRALEVLEEREGVHLVLLDVRMPGIDGVETARRIRELHPPEELAVIMVSAEGDSRLVAEALDAGADDYVTKPVDLPVLLARMRARLRSCTGTGRARVTREAADRLLEEVDESLLSAPTATPSTEMAAVVEASATGWGDTDEAVQAGAASPTRRLPTVARRGGAWPPEGSAALRTMSGVEAITERGAHGRRRVIAGKYRVGKVIGKGGFGAVFRGVHVNLETELAIKVLDRSVTTGPAALERFRREGVAACRVQHPNAVKVYDFGVEPDGMAYLVMELLCGEGLDARMRRRPIFSAQDVLSIAAPICDVLDYAHRQSVVHRDLKPANIFIHRRADTGEEIVKVMDFGVARLSDKKDFGSITATGAVVGTPAFVAPESVVGQPSTGAADIYSLAVMLYVMLSGHHPFVSPGERPKPVDMALAHVQRVAPPVGSHGVAVDPAVAQVVHAAMAKNPRERPKPTELASRLAAAVAAAEGGAGP